MQKVEGQQQQQAGWSTRGPRAHHGPIPLGGCGSEMEPAWLSGSVSPEQGPALEGRGSSSGCPPQPFQHLHPCSPLTLTALITVNYLPDDSLHP